MTKRTYIGVSVIGLHRTDDENALMAEDRS